MKAITITKEDDQKFKNWTWTSKNITQIETPLFVKKFWTLLFSCLFLPPEQECIQCPP